MSAASKEADAIKTSHPSPQLVEAEEKDVHRDESNDVEMSDASLSSQSENANAEGILYMDVDDEMMEERTAYFS